MAESLSIQNPEHQSPPPGASRPCVSSAVLVVDDEPGMRNFLCKALRPNCALVEEADSAESAESLRQRVHFDLLIVDIRLPGQSGIEWIAELRGHDVRTDIIVMTAYANLDTAIAALRVGAADFLLKPFRLEHILASVERCLDRRRIERENFLLRREARSVGIEGLVGNTPGVVEVGEVIRRVAPSNSTVLVEGETGTGKELVARAIHSQSGRSGPFVPLNCGSIPADLLESELFGHARGAFTSAHESREGLFSYAHEGTLFLDEVTQMPLSMQAKLLRVLEEKSIRPVGTDRQVPVNSRVIAATNRPLAAQVQAGAFREDLFYRLNVVAITMPPLRERKDDIPALVSHLSAELASELGVPPLPLSHRDMVELQAYHWPGNVRELRNVIERALLLGKLPGDGYANAPALAQADAGGQGMPLAWSLADVEKDHVLRVLESFNGNKTRAASSLGVSRKTLERKLKVWSEAP